jgi:hypothetical protein
MARSTLEAVALLSLVIVLCAGRLVQSDPTRRGRPAARGPACALARWLARGLSRAGAPSLILRGGGRGGAGESGDEPEIAELRNYSLVERQRAHLEELLIRAQPSLGEDPAALPFKAMLYDAHWRDVMSLCMSASELYSHGVIAHGTLREATEASSEMTPAVYFVRPSAANMAQVYIINVCVCVRVCLSLCLHVQIVCVCVCVCVCVYRLQQT